MDPLVGHRVTLPPSRWSILEAWPIDTDDHPGPAVLLGEAVEDWTGDAVFYEYSTAADPLAAGTISPVPVHRFSPDLHAGGPDPHRPPRPRRPRSGWPARPPVRACWPRSWSSAPASTVVTVPDATSELYYCLRGSGHSQFDRHPGPGRPDPRADAVAGR